MLVSMATGNYNIHRDLAKLKALILSNGTEMTIISILRKMPKLKDNYAEKIH